MQKLSHWDVAIKLSVKRSSLRKLLKNPGDINVSTSHRMPLRSGNSLEMDAEVLKWIQDVRHR